MDRPPGFAPRDGITARDEHSPTTLRTARLLLTALDPSDAIEMVSVLSDVELYEFIGGQPPTVDELAARYRAQVAGPPRPGEHWLNWIIRLADTKRAIGYVQATVIGAQADVAWVIGVAWQHQGFAREAATAMCQWLRSNDVTRITAHIAPEHVQSTRVATALGLRVTDEVDSDGEQIWATD